MMIFYILVINLLSSTTITASIWSNCFDVLDFYDIKSSTSYIALRRLINLNYFLMNKSSNNYEGIADLRCIQSLEMIVFNLSEVNNLESSFHDNAFQMILVNKMNFTLKLFSIKLIKIITIVDHKFTQLSQKMFKNLVNLREFSISRGPVEKIEANAFKSLEKMHFLTVCDAPMISTRNLSFDNDHLLPSIRILFMESNGFEFLETRSFTSLINLQKLLIFYSKIETIENDAFYGLKRLKSLNLMENKIKHIFRNSFRGLTSLSELHMQGNMIKSICSDCFNDLTSLNELGIAGNQIESLEHLPINQLQNVNKISFSNNFISILKQNSFSCEESSKNIELKLNLNKINLSQPLSFSCIKKLNDLDLSHNSFNLNDQDGEFSLLFDRNISLNHLYADSISIKSPLRKVTINASFDLKSLSLMKNQIGVIDNLTFAGLDSLKSLVLKNNDIANISCVSFHGIENLESLDISTNLIRSIENISFYGIPNLKLLDLSENRIQSIQNVNMRGLEKLEVLKLSSNLIRSIDFANFFGIEQLRVLEIRSSLVRKLSNCSINGLENLRSLSLRNSFIDSIETVSMKGLERLEHLDLSRNLLKINKMVYFKGLENLRELNLEMNLISSLENVSFRGLNEKLFKLNLANNYITSLENIEFNGLTNLEELNLTNNLIRSIVSPMRINDLNQTSLFKVILYSNFISTIRPHRFPINFIVHLSKSMPFRSSNPSIRSYYDEISDTYLHYYIFDKLDPTRLCANRHLFLVRNTKYVKAYQSIPTQLEDHDLIKLNCSLLFSMYRRCILIRLFIGKPSDYDSFIQECKSERLELF